MAQLDDPSPVRFSRRQFLGATALAGLAGSANAHAAGSDSIRVGLIGCGGRGTGAAENCLEADPGVKLVAMGDTFADRLEQSREILRRRLGARVDVPEERGFVGLEAYRRVLDCGVDLVILATPPGFRPGHIRAAVAAGKHIFAEKSVAVDPAGVRSVLASHEEARRKGLSVVVGFNRRYQQGYIEAIDRIRAGTIGKVVSADCRWDQGLLWVKRREPGWSDAEWQVRNWPYFTWLSGDIINEQLIHGLDVITWALGTHPLRATGQGGRIERTAPEYGNVYDHFAIDYEFPGGIPVKAHCQQLEGRPSSVGEQIEGGAGSFRSAGFKMLDQGGRSLWQFSGRAANPYVQEQAELIRSIRAGKAVNDLKAAAESALTAILGRMAAYTGEAITWEQAMNSPEDLMPARLAWGPLPVAPVATPRRKAVASRAETGEKYAFLVGVRKYDRNELKDLRFSERDIDELSGVLRAAGYREGNIVTLTQARGAEDPRFLPMASQIRQELRLLLKGLDRDDRVVVAFAGHGVQFRGDPEVYFCPVGAKLSDKSTLVSLGEVYRELGRCKAGFKLLLCDACRNDPQTANMRSRSVVDLESVTRPKKAPPGGLAALFSCSEGEVAYEDEALNHGVFFHFVIQGMRGEADLDRDGVVTLPELETYVKKKVFDFVRAGFGREQTPDLVGEVRGLVPIVNLHPAR